MDINEKLREICRLFRIEGTYVGSETIQVGNVNKTYEVKFIKPDGNPKSYLVQNVNTYAFSQPVELMENIDKVTEHIRGKRPGRVALHFHHTADRKTYVIDGDNFWRLTNYIPSITYNSAESSEIIRNAGRAFGEFQMQLADFDITQLHETIPNFHQTRKRYEKLIASVEADPVGRVAQVQEELDWLMEVQDLACKLTDMGVSGELPLRVTHNDTKINNVLFHPVDNSAMVVIDLDTVMPGLVGHDFGDAIRSGASHGGENETDATKICLDLHLFEVYTRGYLEGATKLTEREVAMLPMGALVITLELATRFLKDYLDGDLYFKTAYPEHNLVRARTQIALVADMQAKWEDMNRIVAQIAAETR